MEEIKDNIEQMKEIIKKIRMFEGEESKEAKENIKALYGQINLLNKAIPDLLKESSPLEKFGVKKNEHPTEQIQ